MSGHSWISIAWYKCEFYANSYFYSLSLFFLSFLFFFSVSLVSKRSSHMATGSFSSLFRSPFAYFSTQVTNQLRVKRKKDRHLHTYSLLHFLFSRLGGISFSCLRREMASHWTTRVAWSFYVSMEITMKRIRRMEKNGRAWKKSYTVHCIP